MRAERQLERGVAVVRADHVEAVLREMTFEEAANVGLRLGDEDCGHACDARSRRRVAARCPLRRNADERCTAARTGRARCDLPRKGHGPLPVPGSGKDHASWGCCRSSGSAYLPQATYCGSRRRTAHSRIKEEQQVLVTRTSTKAIAVLVIALACVFGAPAVAKAGFVPPPLQNQATAKPNATLNVIVLGQPTGSRRHV